MAGSFYEFPNNVVGGALIPILPIPTPIAALTASVSGPNIAVSLRATIGWQAQSTAVSVTNILYKIWRGAPGTGTVVVSALDSGESRLDRNKVTTLAGVDSNFTGAQTVSYVLTAELPDPGTAAAVIGPLTFTTSLNDITADNRGFFFSVIPNNTAGSILIPVTTAPVPLTQVFSSLQANDTVSVRATVGWRALTDVPSVLFKIWRGAPFTGTLVVSALNSAEASFDRNSVTTIGGVDTGITSAQNAVYFLTAEVTNGAAVNVIGPLTMTVARYPAGTPTTAAYVLPNNTANSVLIPLTAAPQPLAALNVTVPANTPIVLRGTVGWAASGASTDVIFKIWRGAPLTGQLLMSADDSGDVDRFNVTDLQHVDAGITATQSVTYVLTAETNNPNLATNVIGPITFTTIQL